MHHEKIELWQHHHTFNVEKKAIEKRTLIVVIVTFVTMIAEILFGWITNSMALLADGWHMGTHAFALGVSLIAYIMARKYAKDQRFTFGTWKVEILGAYPHRHCVHTVISPLVRCLPSFAIVFLWHTQVPKQAIAWSHSDLK
jgi:Co/Zn/Cd efflux system component